MSSFATITADKLNRLIGTPNAPAVIDVRTDEDYAATPYLLPASLRLHNSKLNAWARGNQGRDAVTVCHAGAKLGHGAAALLRHEGVNAVVLEQGFEGWRAARFPLLPAAHLPPRDAEGRTLWVTRSRPKIDRIACPWLIRRFVDASAVFLFVAASEVAGVAERFGATAFDIENVFWSHRGEDCTFDTMIKEFGLASDALNRLAKIVRGADTARLDLAPEAAGLLAVSLGLSRMYSDDLAQLEAGLPVYDAFYRWCRDAVDETHNWPSSKGRA